MRKFYLFWGEKSIVPQAVGQIPWGHNRLILDKINNFVEALFYVQKIIENSWSRVVLDHQIDLNLYKRQGKLQSNFDKTIESSEVEIIKEAFKENYVLDFIGISNEMKERDIEKNLTENISKFILEFGRGFAFVGKQYKLMVGGQEFFIDLLFYNYILKRFIVIELKTTVFKSEYLGQIGLYITAIDRDVKMDDDKETIGLIICKTKNDMVVEYALQNSATPTGVAEYRLGELLEDLKAVLPDADNLKNILDK